MSKLTKSEAVRRYLIHAILDAKIEEGDVPEGQSFQKTLTDQLIFIGLDVARVGSNSGNFRRVKQCIKEVNEADSKESRIAAYNVLNHVMGGRNQHMLGYLQGLASTVPIAFYNNEIFDLMVEWDYAKASYVDHESRFHAAVDDYWKAVSNTLGVLCGKAINGSDFHIYLQDYVPPKV